MSVLLAQTVDWAQPLLNAGVLGVVLVWLMTRVETRMKEHDRRMVAIENAANRTTRAILLLVVSLKNANEAAKTEAKAVMREVDVAEGAQESGRRNE